VPPETELAVSYSGGLFQLYELVLAPLEAALARRSCRGRKYRFLAARLPPDAGAALLAARLSGAPLDERSLAALEAQMRLMAS
jgi:hypothetical protein